MRDQYRALMLTSFKDATEIVEEFNGWLQDAHPDGTPVPPQAVPRVALSLYRSRVMEAVSGSESFSIPDFDDKMYE